VLRGDKCYGNSFSKVCAFAVLGCVCGLALATALARVLAGMLYGVSTSDATTLLGVVLLIVTVAAGALPLPAARAARVDPMRVLREG
jgi:ABC-type antimicrobial peptide transport system permease subunit